MVQAIREILSDHLYLSLQEGRLVLLVLMALCFHWAQKALLVLWLQLVLDLLYRHSAQEIQLALVDQMFLVILEAHSVQVLLFGQ
jgi:hypothetical protein